MIEIGFPFIRSAGSFPGKVQHLKSAIHGLPVTLPMLRVMSDKYDGLRSKNRTPEVAILGVDQKERGLREPQVTEAPLGTVNMALCKSVIIRVCMGI